MRHPKKKVCACARVHVCSTSVGLSVWYNVPHTYVSHISSALKIRICRYVCTRATSPPPKKKTESPAQAQGATHAQRDSHCTAIYFTANTPRAITPRATTSLPYHHGLSRLCIHPGYHTRAITLHQYIGLSHPLLVIRIL